DDGTEDTALMAAVEAEYARYFTATGKKVKSYEEYFTTVENLEKNLDDARAEISTLSAQVDRVARLERERESAQQKLPVAEEELGRRRSEHEAAGKIKEQADDVVARLMRAEDDHRRAVKQQTERAELRTRADTARTAVEAQQEKLAPAVAAAEKEADEIARRPQVLEDARGVEAEAGAAVRTARELVDSRTARARREELEALLGAVDEVNDQLMTLRTRQAGDTPVSAADIDALQQATEQVKVTRALSQARGGSVRLTATTTSDITIDGQTITIDA